MFFGLNGKNSRKHLFFSIDKIIFAAFLMLFVSNAGSAQEMPCLSLRTKQIKFVKTSDKTAIAGCENLRGRKAPSPRQNRGIDDISVAGHITHQNGVQMSGVTVKLENIDSGEIRTVVTGDDGTYFFDGLQIADRIELTPSKENYGFFPPSVTIEGIVYDEVFNFIAVGPPPNPPPPPANQPTLAWTSYYDNPLPPGSSSAPNADYNAMMARDAQGNIFVAGTSYTENYAATGNTDISLYKTDANGNRVWAKTFNGSGNYKDGAVDLAVDAVGNAYITGYAYVGNGQGDDYDYVLVKYDPNGNLLWSKYYSGNGGEDIPRSLKIDAAGNAYVTGYSWGNYANYATVKYDRDGNQMWAKRYSGGFGELATEVEVDANGSVYVTGYSGHSVAGDAEDFLTVKYSPTGEQLWVNRYDSLPGNRNDQAAELEINAAGDCFVMGLSDAFSNGYTILQKINGASGTTAWTKNLNPYDEQEKDLEYRPYAMKLDPSGNVVLAGQIYDYFNDDLDVYVTKLNAEGVAQWTKTYDGPGSGDYDGDPKLALDALGNVYVGISSEGFANFDMQIIKYLPNGNVDWTYRFGNPYLYDDYFIEWIDDNSQTNIFVDANGNVTVAGDSGIPGQSVNLVAFKLEPVAGLRAAPFDFDGDKKADLAVFRPETGFWYIWKSSDQTYAIVKWGLSGDKLVPADYDGDGKNDLAVYRDGVWYVVKSSDSNFLFNQFGVASDTPIPSDFDNDGRADLSVFRQGVWHQLTTSNNSYKAFQFGLLNDTPIPSDYDKNRRSDVAVFRGGNWYVSFQAELPYSSYQFGVNTDKPVPADYDGDAQTDYAVFRNGDWYIRQSRTNSYATVHWGQNGDIPVPADYDGDKKTDLAVYRGGIWYILRSSDNNYTITQFGLPGDIPIPSVYSR
jgi:hypothetical protein